MTTGNETTSRPPGYSEGKLRQLFSGVSFGTVTLPLVDGVPDCGAAKIRYSGKPRSHGCGKGELRREKPPPSQGAAVRDLLAQVTHLKGSWELTLQVANKIPFKWDYEEVRPLRSPCSD